MLTPSTTVTFVADDEGPPLRRLYLARDEEGGPPGSVRGWAFIYDEWREGEWRPGWDTWERWFFEILRYPELYASGPLVWRLEEDGREVDLAFLQPLFDGVAAGPNNLPEDVGLEP